MSTVGSIDSGPGRTRRKTRDKSPVTIENNTLLVHKLEVLEMYIDIYFILIRCITKIIMTNKEFMKQEKKNIANPKQKVYYANLQINR